MKKKKHIVRYTAKQIKTLKDRSDWKRIDSMKDEDIDTSDILESDEEFWKYAKLFEPSNKKMVSFRMDEDVLNWFRAQGKGYQTHMNAVLKAFMESRGT